MVGPKCWIRPINPLCYRCSCLNNQVSESQGWSIPTHASTHTQNTQPSLRKTAQHQGEPKRELTPLAEQTHAPRRANTISSILRCSKPCPDIPIPYRPNSIHPLIVPQCYIHLKSGGESLSWKNCFGDERDHLGSNFWVDFWLHTSSSFCQYYPPPLVTRPP